MNEFFISSSILFADFARLGEDSSRVVSAGVDMIHFDVMDNHYVPNLSMGPMVLRSLRNYGINIPVDVHLMVKPVDSLIPDFVAAGASYIIFHPEATEHIDRSLQFIRGCGCKTGLALNPSTTLHVLEYVMDKIDIILVMSVNPGFGGQLFLPLILEKLRKIRLLIDKYNTGNILLSVDGGVTVENIASIASAGADMFVVGSSIFCAPDYKIVVDSMRDALSVVIDDR